MPFSPKLSSDVRLFHELKLLSVLARSGTEVERVSISVHFRSQPATPVPCSL
jgi:hypothetical protein